METESSETDSRTVEFQEGSKFNAGGPKGRPEAPEGRPKRPRDIDKIGFRSGRPRNVCFSIGNTSFFKNHEKNEVLEKGPFFAKI